MKLENVRFETVIVGRIGANRGDRKCDCLIADLVEGDDRQPIIAAMMQNPDFDGISMVVNQVATQLLNDVLELVPPETFRWFCVRANRHGTFDVREAEFREHRATHRGAPLWRYHLHTLLPFVFSDPTGDVYKREVYNPSSTLEEVSSDLADLIVLHGREEFEAMRAAVRVRDLVPATARPRAVVGAEASRERAMAHRTGEAGLPGREMSFATRARLENAGRSVKAFDSVPIEFLPSPGEWGYVATMCSGPDGGWLRRGFFKEQYRNFRDSVAVLPGAPLTEWEEVLIEGLSRECGVRFITEGEVADYMKTEGAKWRALFTYGHPKAATLHACAKGSVEAERLTELANKARKRYERRGVPADVNRRRGAGAPVRPTRDVA